MLIIYCDSVSPRLKYTLNLLFRDILRTDFLLVDNKEKFIASDLSRISYAKSPVNNELFLFRDDFISEGKIKQQDIKVSKWQDIPVFFNHRDKKSAFPFDPFSMIFYMVNSYEEYLHIGNKDKHGRTVIENSLAYRHGFYKFPLVNIIARKIEEELGKKYPDINLYGRKYEFTPTYDIDIAYAHLAKGALRTVAGYAKLLARLQFKAIAERTSTLLGFKDDPYDNFDQQFEIHQKCGLKPVYFVNMGDYSRYDKNVSHKNKRFRQLIKKISEVADIGIHPSYYSGLDIGKTKTEKERLEDITGKKVTKSRQHFLKLNFPDTYRNLIELGIEEDYSMGYYSHAGYRAGICSSFRFYDLKSEEETELTVFPFAFMDTVFESYMKLKPAEIIELVKPMINEVKSIGGHLTAIWHNYALSDNREKLKTYREIIKLAVADKR